MKGSSQARRIHALSMFFAAVPFAFALIRYGQTGPDLRYLWLALASWLGATLVMVVGKAPSRILTMKVALSAGAFVMAMLFALLAVVLLGTTVELGI